MMALGTESLFVIVVLSLTGLGLVSLGRHLKRTQDVTLVAGFHRDEVADEAALTELIGNVVIVIGIVTVLVGFIDPWLSSTARIVAWSLYVTLTMGLAVWADHRGERYT